MDTQTSILNHRLSYTHKFSTDRKTLTSSPLRFKKINSSDMDTIWPYLNLETGRTTDFSYGGILMWVDFYHYEYCIYNNTLFIKGLSEENRYSPSFSLPLGNYDLKDNLTLLRDYCLEKHIRLQFSAIPEAALRQFELLKPVCIEELKDYADYLYPANQLCTLTGKKMAKKRNHCNRFESEHPDWRLIPISSDNLKDAMDFMDLYDTERDNSLHAEAESILSRNMIEKITMGDKHLIGALLVDGNRVIALSIGDIKNDTLFIHVEKADRMISGSYEFINKSFASQICASHPEILYINREDDCGDMGLRMAKESYHPLTLLKKYNIFF